MTWIIGLISFALFGGGGWLFWRSRSSDVVRRDVAEEKKKAAEKHIEDIKDAKKIDNDIDRSSDADNRDRLRDRWTRKE